MIIKTVPSPSGESRSYPLTLLFDGGCPICNLEMDNLKARNSQGRLAFIDIAQPHFDPAPFGASLQAMNALIHAVRPDGSLVVGTEVFRLAYGAVGLEHWAAPSGWPLLKPLLDRTYAAFARNRYGISRVFMPALERLRARRAAKRAVLAAGACSAGTCSLIATTHSTERTAS